MLNNITSQTQMNNIKPPIKHLKKVDEQIVELSNKIDELSNEINTEKIIVDEVVINTSLTSPNAEIDNINSKLISGENLQIDNINTADIQAQNANLTNVNSTNIEAETATVSNLTIREAFNTNEINTPFISTTKANIDELTVNKIATNDIEISNSIITPEIETNKIDVKNIDVENNITADNIIVDTSITVPNITTENIITDNIVADTSKFNEAEIQGIITNTLNTKDLIKFTGSLPVSPSLNSHYDNYAVDIKLGNYTIYLRTEWTDINSVEHKINITIIGTEKAAIICYNENVIEDIVDVSFDKNTGNLRIRFKNNTEEPGVLYYGLSTNDELVEPLRVLYNVDALDFYHTPRRQMGYIFQSYWDDNVEFYFGGEVFVHSLTAEFEKFDEQQIKRLYLEENIFTPSEYFDDESVRRWTEGGEGDYLTNRINEFDNLRLTWENKTTIVNNENKSHLIDANAVINYTGDVITPNEDPALEEHNYPITHLGDETITHGQHKIEGNTITKHIYDGAAEEMPLMPNNALVIHDANGTEIVYRKYTPNFTDTSVWTEDANGYVCNLTNLYFTYDNEWVQLSRVNYDGTNYEMVDINSNTISGLDIYQETSIPRTAKITRKTTKNGNNKYDEIAVYESSKVLQNNKPVIYNSTNRSLETTEELTIEELDVNKLTVREWLKSLGDTTTKHIYDGVALSNAELSNRPNGSLYIDDTTNTLYRKTTNADTTVRLDRVATLKDGQWVGKNDYPLIYDEATDTLKPSKELKLSELDISGDLRVGGDAYITGTLHYTQEELIESTSDFILLRANNSASLAVGEEAGIAINNYDGSHTLAIATDRTGTARVGAGTGTSTTYNDIYYGLADSKWYIDETLTTEVTPAGNLSSWTSIEKTDDYYHYTDAVFKVIDFTDMQAIATRDEEAAMSHNAITKWNAEDKKLQTIPLPVRSEQTLEAVVTVNDTDPEEPITTVGYTWVDKKAGVLHFATEAAYTAYEATHNVPNDTLVIIDEYDTNLMGDNQI